MYYRWFKLRNITVNLLKVRNREKISLDQPHGFENGKGNRPFMAQFKLLYTMYEILRFNVIFLVVQNKVRYDPFVVQVGLGF